MKTFLRYLVYWCIVWYIIGGIHIVLSRMLEHILGFQETREGVVFRESYILYYVADRLRMQEMYNEIMHTMPNAFHCIIDHFKTQEMCNKKEKMPWVYFSLQFVPDWFVTQQQIDVWYDDDDIYNDNEMIKWYNGYKTQKVQKAKIKEELLPIAWHSDRVMDWCMSKDKER